MKRSRLSDPLKRTIDVLVSGLMLVLLSPVLAVVAIAVLASMGRPVFFRQPRPGLHGRCFDILKFRTMTSAPDGVDAVTAVATDSARITPVGRFLRSTSLDELPTLWNVLVGDMSLVGPRPLLPEYLPRYNEEQARRHDVRPGITGWAQVNGRNATSWEERLAMDTWYVDHRSLALDLRIALLTVATVLGRKGVSAPGEATMRPFDPERDRDGDRS